MNTNTPLVLVDQDKVRATINHILSSSSLGPNKPVPEINFFLNESGLIQMQHQPKCVFKEIPFREAEYKNNVLERNPWNF